MTIYHGNDPARITATKGTRSRLAVRATHAESGVPLHNGDWIGVPELRADRPEKIGEAITEFRYADMDDSWSRRVTRFAYAHNALQVARNPDSGSIFVMFDNVHSRDSFEAALPTTLATVQAVGPWDFLLSGAIGQ